MQNPKEFTDRIEIVVYDTLFQRNDRVVRYSDSFRAYFRAALCDVAIADTVFFLQVASAASVIQWMHFQGGRMDTESWSGEMVVKPMLPQDMTDVLT